MIEPLALSINDTAAAIGTGRSTVYNEINKGNLDAHKVGRRTIVKIESVRKFLAERDRYPTTVKSNDSQPD